MAEAGLKWIPNTMKAMDDMQAKQDEGSIGALTFIHPFHLERKPSDYWDTNCWVGASFMTREDAIDRDAIGVHHIMWGSDFPHEEGTFPFSRESLAHTYAGMDATEVARMLGGTAADVYGFDLHKLGTVGQPSSVRKLTWCGPGSTAYLRRRVSPSNRVRPPSPKDRRSAGHIGTTG